MATSGQLKTENIIIRVTPNDKEEFRKIALRKGMSLSEMLLYLIRREVDWEKHDEDRKTYKPLYED